MAMLKTELRRRVLPPLLVLVGLCLGQGTASYSQTQRVPYEKDRNEDRAGQQAEQMVSLSAAAIRQILDREPGLLLEVKKLLVRKAYEQGRLLDPDDLSDDNLFSLLQLDNTVRILATREIEARRYVRAKPRMDELQPNPEWRPHPSSAQPAEEDERREPKGSQEEQYWPSHRGTAPRQPQLQETPPEPEPSPAEPLPDFAPNYSRFQSLAGTEPPARDDFEAPPPGSGNMPRVTPGELPGLLQASMGEDPVANVRPEAGTRGPESFPSELGSSFGSSFPRRESSPASANLQPRPRFRQPERRRSEVDRDQPAIRTQPNPYQDIPSLYDLYKQVSKSSPVPRRFGLDVFQNGSGNYDMLPMDMPVGPDYIVGPGDGLSIEIWGSVSGRLQRAVDRQGLVMLPDSGAVQVAGKSLAEVQQLMQARMRTQYRAAQVDVSLARLRTVRVYVVGDVARPGAYDVSALSTPLNALYLAGGPTSRGSVRILRHLRANQLIESADVYDLLLHGVRDGGQRLEAGDTIQIPPLGPQVTVEGTVRRPAIYELKGEMHLAEVLELAGGVLTTGTLRHIEVERVVAHESRTMLRLDLPEDNTAEQVNQALAEFEVHDGDKIRISPIVAYSEKTVYLDGHVFHPGKYAYRDGMRLTDLIHSYRELLPEPAALHAEIIRLNPPDFSPTVLAFNLAGAMNGGEENVPLKAFDTVRIFSRFDFEEPPLITVSGEVHHPGDHFTNGKTYLRDAVYLAGGTTPEALLSDAQLFRKTADGKLRVISVDLAKAISGDAKENVPLEPMDRLFIHKNLEKADPPSVKIEGQIAQPGKYPLAENMTVAGLVRVAGGLKRGAYTEAADLTRYEIQQGSNVVGEHTVIALARALNGEPDTDMRLRDGDVLTVRELAGWNDVGATIAVKGEVLHPGTYGIQEGERLSSILRRAGGFRSDAYPHGVIFERVQVRELEQTSRDQLLHQVQIDGSNLALIPELDPAQKNAKEAAVDQWHAALQNLQSTPPSGRLTIRITKDIPHWATTSADIQVRAGDVIYIPKEPTFVMVDGSVYNPTAVAYRPGKSAGWYLQQAGGPTNMANKKAIIVIRADGSVAGGSGGMLSGGVTHAALQPGDLVMVPEKAFSGTTKWKTTLESAQLASAVGIAIQVARSF
ncbi:MAG TPA: SLBB domain-containing protein [Candidatus Acidoferrum sp.]|jgi:protein involved in polysaccharide export with SLBB domain|nr:SLBB domain-containing protein [Candidatus Acidoferrum sp.]